MPDPGGVLQRGDVYHAAVAMVEAMPPSDARPGTAQTLERLCSAAVSSLGLLGAAARLMPASGVAGLCVTSPDTAVPVGELEADVGEGPGATAYALRRPVLVPDLAGPRGNEWPVFRNAAQGLGVGAVFVFPIQLGAALFGTLELFAARPGALTHVQVGLARAYAEIAVEFLLDGHLTTSEGELSLGLAQAFEQRATIAQAQGMIMVDLGVDLGEAMARLRAHAFATGASVLGLARNVIDGYVLPSDGSLSGGD